MAAAITLTTAQKNQITQLAVLREKGNAGVATIDDLTASELTRIFGTVDLGVPKAKNLFMDRLRDAPVSTLLRLILSVAP